MKAILLAGGQGRRLRSITGKLPKPLVPLVGVPVLDRLLELLRQLRSKGMTAQIGEIRFEESGIVLRYQDRLDVYLDREDDFAYRLRNLAAVLEKLEENETGTIRWDAEGSARFIPG